MREPSCDMGAPVHALVRRRGPLDEVLRDASAVGPLGALALPAPAAVRRSPGAPAFRSAAAAACSLRLRALQAGLGARSGPGAAAAAGPIARTPARAPRES